MGEIIFEDYTKPTIEKFKAFCGLVSIFIVSKALESGFSLREVALAIFKAGEDLINYGSLSGDIEEDDVENIKREAADMAGEKLNEVETDGIADVIRKYGNK